MGRGRNIAICIGAKKAGTTWLYQCLREHPEVHVSPVKEPHYFSKHYESQSFNDYLNTIEFTDLKINYESSVDYFACAEAPERIAHHFPDARLILVLRDPVERVYSDFQHFISRKRIDANVSMQEAIEKEPALIEYSYYGKHLQRYVKYFSPNQIHVVFQSEMYSDPQNVIDNLCRYLHIEPFTPSILYTMYHTSRARSHPLYFFISKKYQRLKRTVHGQTLIRWLKKVGINSILFERLFSMRGTTKSISRKERALLLPYFEDDMQLLQALLKKIGKPYREIEKWRGSSTKN